MIKNGMFYFRLYALSTALFSLSLKNGVYLIREKSGFQWHYDKRKFESILCKTKRNYFKLMHTFW